MFPNGVIYEGVSDTPMYFRGESGANDSMIPLGDKLLEITASLPENELTRVLREFREYRPPTQREYIAGIEARARLAKVKEFAFADEKSLALYVLNVDQIREFRQRHWSFTKEYIIRRSSYGIATGGSPILRYLPSNLATVTNVLAEACAALPDAPSAHLSEELREAVAKCKKRADTQLRVLEAEMSVWGIVEDQKRIEAERTATASSQSQGERLAAGPMM
jgi:indoleamine 2,3-dioxygenase